MSFEDVPLRVIIAIAAALLGIHHENGPSEDTNAGRVFEEWLALNGTGKFIDHGRGAEGGFVDFLCPSRSGAVLFGDCMTDCVENHGAVEGSCGNPSQGDYNCYCGKRIIHKKPKSLHCVKRSVGYSKICEMDCMCNHAAVSGSCDWENKACLCEKQGTNKANVGCVASSWHPFTDYIHSQIGHEGLQWVDDPYHWFIKGDKPLPNQRAGWGGWWGVKPIRSSPPRRNLRASLPRPLPGKLSWWSGKACNSATGETDSHPDGLATCSQWCQGAHGYAGGYCSSSYCYCISP